MNPYQAMKYFWSMRMSAPFISGAVGFGFGGTVLCLFLFLSWDLTTVWIGAGVAGAIGGGLLAHKRDPQHSAVRAVASYFFGFLVGGMIFGTLLGVLLEMRGEISYSLFEFYLEFVFGFCVAGAGSAAIMHRPKLISVANSTISFLIASGLGGLAIVVLVGSPVDKRYIAAIGLLVTYTVGGALSAAVSESDFSSGTDEELT